MIVDMGVRQSSFDDPIEDDLFVFSGNDLLTSYLDGPDLDWREVAERTAIDARRGLVVLQVAVLEDVIDELILYLEDTPDQENLAVRLSRQTFGPRLDRLERLLRDGDLWDEAAEAFLADLRAITKRRNELAHGVIKLRPVGGMPKLGQCDFDFEWVITSRKSRANERITMSGLRNDLYDAIALFTAALQYGDALVQRTPRRRHFKDGQYVSAPSRT